MQPDAIELQPDAIELQPDAIELQPDAIELQPDAIELQLDAIELQLDAIELQLDAIAKPGDYVSLRKPSAIAPKAATLSLRLAIADWQDVTHKNKLQYCDSWQTRTLKPPLPQP